MCPRPLLQAILAGSVLNALARGVHNRLQSSCHTYLLSIAATLTLPRRPLAYFIIPRFGYLTDKLTGYEGLIWKRKQARSMRTIEPKEIEHLKQMLVEYHSGHAQEHGPIPTCKEPTCVETKLALGYLAEKHSPQIDLRGFEDR